MGSTTPHTLQKLRGMGSLPYVPTESDKNVATNVSRRIVYRRSLNAAAFLHCGGVQLFTILEEFTSFYIYTYTRTFCVTGTTAAILRHRFPRKQSFIIFILKRKPQKYSRWQCTFLKYKENQELISATMCKWDLMTLNTSWKSGTTYTEKSYKLPFLSIAAYFVHHDFKIQQKLYS